MSWWRIGALAALLLLALAAGGCADGDPVAVSVAGSGAACEDSLSVTVTSGGGSSGALYNEAPDAAAPAGCDPFMESRYDTSIAALLVPTGWTYNTTTAAFENRLEMALLGPEPATLPVSYAVKSVPAKAGEAAMTYDTNTYSCTGKIGTVTVDVYGPVGTPAEGTFDVTGFDEAGCPDGVSGSFSATREPDL